MKKILILVYVLAVASLSITARAESNIPLLVDNISHIENAKMLQVSGSYPNPCIANPIPALTQNEKGQLELNILGESTADICIQIVGPQFLLAVDLNVLKADIKALGLDDKGTYEIFDNAGNLITKVNFAGIFHRIPFTATEITGILTVEENGLYVDGPLGARIQVKSKLNNLEDLDQTQVTLTGHMMTHSVSQPIFKSNIATPQFIATGVSFSIAD